MHKPLSGRITRRQFAIASSSALVLAGSPLLKLQAFAASLSGRSLKGNAAVSPDERADKLLAQMTLDEKITMVHGAGFQNGTTGYVGHIPANTRLGIPALHLEDGPAGVADGVPGVTAFPAPIAGAASWDTALMQQYGQALGTEEYGKGTNIVLAPTVNILRNPQWGRSFESLGEDPYLSSQMVVADIKGIQSLPVIATVKHLACNNQEFHRFTASANIDERTLQEIYLPAFKAAIEQGNVGAVMGAYNKINDTYCCENPYLLTTVLREQAGFKGIALSDWGATHSTVASAEAGLDIEMPDDQFFGAALKTAIENGQVSITTLNTMVHRILRTMFAYGLFDFPSTGTLTTDVESAAHTQLARRVAEQGAVLLKNDQRVLPLDSRKIKTIALIGADASTGAKAVGGGSASVITPYVVTPLQGITTRAGSGISVQYADGSNLAQAAQLAKSADVALVFVNDIESEGSDRSSLSLPNNQDQLVETVAQANPRTIVVINSGAPVLMPWVSQVPGIIEAWYSGQEDGNAIAAILFGDVNPSGKLPITFPVSASDVPANTPQQYPGINDEASYSEGVFVGYRHYDEHNITPLFPFGHGLSYTTFAYSHLALSPGADSRRERVTVSVVVTNSGPRPGAEVVQLYVGIPSTNVPEPPKQLRGFQKVFLHPGQSKRVTFSLDSQALSYWDVNIHNWVVQKGTYKIMVGSSSRDIRVSSSFQINA
jgi:beta-glucosidase